MGKVRWHTNPTSSINQSLTLKFVAMSEEGNETYLGLTFKDFTNAPNRRYAATQRDLLDMNHQHLSLTHSISPVNRLSISTTMYTAKTSRDWARVNSIGGVSISNILADPSSYANAYQIMIGQSNGNLNYQSAARTYHVFGLQSNATYQFETGQIRHQIQAGIRFHQDDADRYATQSTYLMSNGMMALSTAGVKGNAENQIRNAKSLAGYMQYEVNVGRLVITPGIRYENIDLTFDNYGTNDNARIGAALKSASNHVQIYLPGIGMSYAAKENMRIFGGVNKGFSPPGMPSVSSSSTQAMAETALNYELGYRVQTKRVKMQVIGFVNMYQNILGSDNVSGGGAGTGDMFNAGKAKIQGIEWSLEQNLVSSSLNWKMPLSIAYTYNNAQFLDTFVNAGGDWGSGQINRGEAIPFITPHLLSVSIGIESNKMQVTLVNRYVGNTRIKTGNSAEILPSETAKYMDVNTIRNYWVMDLSANYYVSTNITFFATLNNLLNKPYIVANLPQGFRPGMPFAANMGIKLNL